MKDFERWLDSFLNFEKTQKKNIFWLDTIRFLCGRFGNPQDYAPCIHVAGSKGKGSVSKMIACILGRTGRKCGLYLSPHVSDFRERIGDSAGMFPDEIYDAAAEELTRGVGAIRSGELPGGRPLTWFELATLYAFLCFRRAEVSFAVYETGLGGRLDATNVVKPELCCIMPVELEHTEFLGNTVEKIAAEKAGIIKDGVPVVIACQRYPAARDIFLKSAQNHKSKSIFVDSVIKSISYEYAKDGRMDVRVESPVFRRPLEMRLRLMGSEQARNAAAAALAVKTLFPDTDESLIEAGAGEAALPGRFERCEINGGVPLILDGAHTVNSIRLTVETFRSLYADSRKLLLFACAADKDVSEMAGIFSGVFDEVVITRPGSVRKSDLEAEKRAFAGAGIPFTAEEDCRTAAAALFKNAAAGDAVLAAGSFYLVAEIKKYLSEM